MIIPKEVQLVLDRLNQSYEAYIVGGFVRDNILNRECYDYDITTSALPEEVKQCFSDYSVIETGIKHGTVTVIIDHIPIEITTYRIDKEYLDNRHPSEVQFTRSLDEDLKRRDFTVNALCYKDNHIIDYFNGLNDLNDGIIRAIGDPIKRFEEDALRILRAIRFSAQLNFEIETKTKQALFHCKEKLSNIAIERIMKEFEKILVCDNIDKILIEYHDIFSIFLPELKNLKLYPSFYQKTMDILHNTPKNFKLRLAAIFSQMGCTISNSFCDKDSALIFKKAVLKLKLPISAITKIYFLLSHSSMPLECNKSAVKTYIKEYDMDLFDLITWKEIISDHSGSLEDIRIMAENILDNNECYSLKQLKINGKDIEELGFNGKQVGILLNECLDAVINEKILNQYEDLLHYIQSKE